jgi:hypothetical protein
MILFAQSIKQETLDGTDVVRLKCKANSTKKNLVRLQTATLWLDASRYWLLRKAVAQYGFKNSQSEGQGEVTYTYQYNSVAGLPVVDSITRLLLRWWSWWSSNQVAS